ncbi:TrkA C-terminal domain-containing protein [Halopenitus sp. H-Gu1]|uniref:TrkA C-terminal domain-containing protein n=1 Tax=Halopenitus sp. H-Gu1 TaxID=3242697 RepID=UPI00359E8450
MTIGIYAVIFVLVVLAFSVIVIRTGTRALTMTGLSAEIATFQAVSAFTGVGFTTREAEDAISTPGRRRIVMVLILAGNVGIITGIVTLILSFMGGEGGEARRFIYLVIGSGTILLFARSRWFDRLITPLITWGLDRTTSLAVGGSRQLLQRREGYGVAEIYVGEDHRLANEPLRKATPDSDSVLALGIVRADGSYVSVPNGDEILRPGETLLVYGQKRRLKELSEPERDDPNAP